MLTIMLTWVTLASEPALYQPAPSDAPGLVEAMETAERWFEWAIGSPTAAEVPLYVRPSQPSAGTSASWASDLVDQLSSDRTLGRLLRESGGPALAVEGPDYRRVVFPGTPFLSLVVREVDGEVFVDRVEQTSCLVCSEPARAVHDLLARARAGQPVLWPNLDLHVRLANERRHLGAHGTAALQARARRGDLRAALATARVVKVQNNEVTVDIQGAEETWILVYDRGSWQVDYDSLPEDSQVRLPRQGRENFKPRGGRTREILDLFEPHRKPVPGGTEIATRVIGAAFDPSDSSLLVALFDVDRTTAGLVRIDPNTLEVLDRWPTRAAPRIPIDLENWFSSWHMALAPDGRKVALSSPGQIDTVDLSTGARSLVYAFDQASHLAWVDTNVGDVLVIGQRSAVHLIRDGRHSGIRVDGPTVAVSATGSTLHIVTEHGSLHAVDLARGETETVPVCCGHARGAALDESRDILWITCPETCEQAAERFDVVGRGLRTPIPGAGTPGQAVACSSAASSCATAAMGDGDGLLLWDYDGHPLTTAGTGTMRRLEYDPRGDFLVGVTESGSLQIFDMRSIERNTLVDGPAIER